MKKHLFRQGRHLLAALLFAFSPGLSQAQGEASLPMRRRATASAR